MNDVITSREELLLAKIAGHDVDIKTMTPPVASNLSEKFMLEIADRLDNMGGDPAETETVVLETTLGEGKALSTDFIQYTARLDSLPDIPNEGVYLSVNGTRYPLISVDSEDYVYTAAYNVELPEGTPLGTPWFMVGLEEKEGTGVDVPPGLLGGADTIAYILTVAAGEPIDNAEIQLIHKQSASAGGKFVVTLSEEEVEEDVYELTADKSVAACIAAYEAGMVVECHMDEEVFHLASVSSDTVGFSKTEYTKNRLTTVQLWGSNEKGGDGWSADSEPIGIPDNLKPCYEFGFTATPDGQGGFTATPDEGATYNAIRAALTETPLVFARVAMGTNYVVGQFNDVGSSAINATMICRADVGAGVHFYAVRLQVASGDLTDIVLEPIGQ